MEIFDHYIWIFNVFLLWKVLINSSLADQSQIVSKIIQENGKSENNIENCVNTETVGGLLFCTCYDFVVKSVKQVRY